jgi:hypothetical protein
VHCQRATGRSVAFARGCGAPSDISRKYFPVTATIRGKSGLWNFLAGISGQNHSSTQQFLTTRPLGQCSEVRDTTDQAKAQVSSRLENSGKRPTE